MKVAIENCSEHGVTIMGVNKVFNGSVETALAMIGAGIKTIAESRVGNLKKLKDLSCETCLLRTPGLSEIKDVIQYADISLNSELAVIKALSKEGVKQNKIHKIILMIDIGDIREGIWFRNKEEIETTIKEIIALPNIELYGLGTNFNCYGSVIPTMENGNLFVQIAREIELKFGIKFKYLSGGNATSYYLMKKGTWPKGINHLRIGGLFEFGIDYVEMKYLDEFYHSKIDIKRAVSDLYILKAEIIELNTKPTIPYGELGYDAFLQKKVFEDRGHRRRALLAVGRQDLPMENIWPRDSTIEILGQTSDHTIIDIEKSAKNYRVGDIIDFEIDYTGLMMAFNSPGITKRFIKEDNKLI